MADRRAGRPLTTPPRQTVPEGLLRTLTPQVVGAVARRYGDFAGAEDATQEALIAAARRWPVDGVPYDPRAWLIRTASRRLIDQWRADSARRDREVRAARHDPALAPDDDDAPRGDSAVQHEDDSLTLLFLCCHPALTPASAVALTLRAVGGLTTAEIARAYVVPETTMAQRISRAKRTLAAAGGAASNGVAAPFHMPAPEDYPARRASVLAVLYLMFNEGYVASSGAVLGRPALAAEAIRITRLAHAAAPGDGEFAALLALMLLTEARRPARTSPSGALVPLAEQDRSLWDRDLIREGTTLLDGTISSGGSVGAYHLQAAIAALHDRAATAADTDWPQILALYGLLERVTGNPVVRLNRAVATAMVHGPRAGLAVLDELSPALAGHHRVHAVRAHLLADAGDTAAARAEYRLAIAHATNLAERAHLTLRAAALGAPRDA